jgi:fibronectin-binding autotransporter adhesin
LTLSGANAFTGSVAVDGGTAKIGSTNAFGAHNTAVTKVVVASGAAVDFNGIIDAVYGYTISGDGVGGTGALLNTGVTIGTGIRQASNIKLAADAAIGGTGNWALLTSGYAATTLDLAGHTLTKVGTNTFALANATITAGSIRIAGGTISQIGNNKPGGHDASAVAWMLDNTAGATLNLNNLNLNVGSISGGGTAGGGVALGSGTLTVGALNATTTYSGTISGSGGLIKSGSGTLTLGGNLNHMGNTTVAGGTLTLNRANVLFPVLGATGQFGSAHVVTVHDGGTLQLNANWVMGDGLANQVVVDGGTLQFLNSDNYLGNIVLIGGTITTSGGSHPWRTGNWGSGLIQVHASATPSTISGALTFVGTAAAPRTTFRVADGAAAEDLIVSANINDHLGFAGAMRLVKEGAGTMRLNNARSFSGGTTISQGTVLFSHGSAFGPGAVTLNDANTGSLDTAMLATGALAISNSIVVANQGTGTSTIGSSQFDLGAIPTVFSGSVTLNKNTTFTGGNTDRTTYTGVITGTPGMITVSGGRRTTWDNTNTFDGDVGISGSGTILQLNGSTNVIPDASHVDVGAGAFLYSNNVSETIAGLSGSGRVQKHPSVNAPFALTVGYGDASSTFDGVITNGNGVLSLTKIGSGTLTLTGTNAYTGVTRISGGALSVPRLSLGNTAGPWGAALGHAANLVFDGGTLQYTGTTSYVGPSAINRPFTVLPGGGTIEIANAAATVEFDSSAGANSPVGSSGRLTLTGAGNGIMTQILGSSLTGGVLKSGSGTWTLNPGVVHNGYLPASLGTTTLLTGRTVADLDGVAAGVMNGGSIGSNRAATVYNYSNDGSVAQFALAFFDGTYTKAVKIQLADSADNVVGTVLSARYWIGNVLSPAFNYDTTSGGNVQSIATSDGAGGYGAKSLTLLVSTDSNAYSGGTTIRQGTLRATHSGSMGTGEVTLGDAGTGSDAVAWLIAAQAALSNAAVVADLGTGPATLGSYSVGPAAEFSGPLTLNRPVTLTDATGDRTTFSGQISGDVGTMTIAGNRVALANGNNDFVGGLTVSSGSVYQNDASGAIPDGTSVLVDGSFQLNGVDETIDALNGSGTIRNHGGANTLIIGAADASGTFTGRILDGSGTLSLVKTGAGSQMLAPLTGSTTYDATFVPATPATVVVLPNVDLADVTGVSSAIMNGGAISPQNAPAAAYNFSNDGVRATFAIAIFQGGWTKAVKIQLTRSGSHVVATALSARYWSGNVLSDSFNYDTTSGANNSSIAISDAAGGYGCKSLTLTLASPYTGATMIDGGTLLVNGSITSDATVNSGGTLGGHGTIVGNVTSTGTGIVNPGNSPGILIVDGNYSANTVFEINAPYLTAGEGGDYDQIIVNGGGNTIDLSAATVTFVSVGGGTVPALPNLITLIRNNTNNAITPFSGLGERATVTLGTGGDAREFIVSYTGGDGNDMVLFDATQPDTVYVSPSFTGSFGQLIDDADFGTSGNQSAVFGVNAFATISDARSAVTDDGIMIVNEGTYNEAVVLAGTQTLRITGPDADQTVIIDSLATVAGQSVMIQGTSNLTVGDATSTTIAGTISGDGSLTKVGTGTVVLGGANAYTGGTMVSQGTLTVTHSAALGSGTLTMNGGTLNTSVNLANSITLNNTTNTLAPNGNYRVLSGQISGVGGFTVANGGGTPGLELNNPANNFSGNVTINSNTYLRLTAGEVIPNTASVTNDGHLRLDVSGGGTETIAGLSGSGAVWVPNNNNNMHTLVVGANEATSSYAGTIGAGGQNNAYLRLTKTGTGVLTLSNASVFSGGTLVNEGTVAVHDNNALGSGTITLAGGTLRPGGTGSRILANPIQAVADTESNLLDNVGGGDLVLTGSVSGAGTLTVNSTLSRSLWFQGDNSGFTGTLNFTNNSNGTNLRLGGTGTSVNNSTNGSDFRNASFVLSGNTTNNRGVFWNGAPDTAVWIGSLSGTGRLWDHRSPHWHIGSLDADTTFAGIIEGANTSLSKTGTGTLTLQGKNTFGNGTTVSQGTLMLQAPSVSWNAGVFGGTATVENGATLRIDTGWNTSSNDTVYVNGGGTLHFSAPFTAAGGNTTYLGAIHLDSSNGQPAVVTGLGAVRMGFNANGLITSTGTVTNTYAAGLQLVNGSSRTVTIGTDTDSSLDFDGIIHDYTGLAGTPLFKTGAGTLTLASANTYTGNTTVSGGVLLIPAGGKIYHGGYRTSTVTVNNGGVLDLYNWTYSESGAASLGGLRANSPSLVIDNGTIRMNSATSYGRGLTIGAGGATFEAADGADWTLAFDATHGIVSTSGGPLTLGGSGTGRVDKSIPGTGALNKVGSGTWNLTANNLYAGPTTVSAGTLLVNGSIAGSSVTVQAGATLGGTGTTGPLTIDNGGTHAPGNSPGITTVDGNYVENGLLAIEITTLSGNVAGTDYDQVKVIGGGSVAIGGTATLTVSYTGTLGTFNPGVAQVYTIIDNDGTDAITGQFSNAAAGAEFVVDGKFLKLFYNGGDGNDVVLVSAHGTPNTLYVNNQWTSPAMVDGDLEQTGFQTAYIGIDAFATIEDALAAYPSYAGPIVVNGGTYASAPLAGGGNVTLRLVQDLANGEPNVTLQNLTGDAGDAIVTRFHNAANANLTVEQGSFAGNISGAGSLTKFSAGTLTAGGNNTYSGGTAINDGTLRLGSSTALPSANPISLAGTAVLDLHGNNATVTNVTSSVSTATITDTSATTGTSTFTVSNQATTINALVLDGTSRAIAVRVANSNGGSPVFALTSANTFSGGLTLLHTANGTRLQVSGAPANVGSASSIVSSPFGRGAITIGQAATDRAGIFFSSANATVLNPIVFNTVLGTDRPGIRADATGIVLAGTITANLSDASFSSNGTGSITLTGQLTGPRGLYLDNVFGSSIAVTLNNAGTPNNYQGNTTIAGSKGTLVLGANHQIPDGAGVGDVDNSGTLNLNGRSETVNGLFGGGTVTNSSGTAATLTVGANDTTSAFYGRIQNGTTTGANVVNLTKIGLGTFTLLNNNRYSGTTTVSQGTLRLGADGMSPVAAGLAYQLDATQTATMLQAVGGSPVTATGQSVAQWNVLPAAGTNFVQATAIRQPTYQSSAINGRPAVRFDGADDQLVLSSAVSPQNVFVVSRPNATQKGIAGVFGNSSPGDKGIRFPSSTSPTTYNSGDTNDFTFAQNRWFVNGLLNTAFAANTPHVLSAIRGTSHTAAYNNNVLGGYFGGREWAGDVGEVLVYTTALTTQHRLLNEAYLYGKWIALAPNILPDNSVVVVADGATLDINGRTETVGSLATDAISATTAAVLLGSGGALLAGGNNATTTFAGTISGNGSLVKTGTGIWSLTNGGNSYTGATTVLAGTLRVTADGALGAVTAGTAVLPGASLVLDNVAYLSSEPLTLSGTARAGTEPLSPRAAPARSPGRSPSNTSAYRTLPRAKLFRKIPRAAVAFRTSRRRQYQRELGRKFGDPHRRRPLRLVAGRSGQLTEYRLDQHLEPHRLLRRSVG